MLGLGQEPRCNTAAFSSPAETRLLGKSTGAIGILSKRARQHSDGIRTSISSLQLQYMFIPTTDLPGGEQGQGVLLTKTLLTFSSVLASSVKHPRMPNNGATQRLGNGSESVSL